MVTAAVYGWARRVGQATSVIGVEELVGLA